MSTLEMILEFTNSLGLKNYPVLNESGEIIDDSTVVAGYNSSKEIDLSLEYIESIPGVKASSLIFKFTADRQSAIRITKTAQLVSFLTSAKKLAPGMCFDVDDDLYCAGIIVTADI